MPTLGLGFCCPDSPSAVFELCAPVTVPKFLRYKIETTVIIKTTINHHVLGAKSRLIFAKH